MELNQGGPSSRISFCDHSHSTHVSIALFFDLLLAGVIYKKMVCLAQVRQSISLTTAFSELLQEIRFLFTQSLKRARFIFEMSSPEDCEDQSGHVAKHQYKDGEKIATELATNAALGQASPKPSLLTKIMFLVNLTITMVSQMYS